MTTISVTGEQRFHILNLLPQESGSLQESIQIKRMRDQVTFSDDEKEKIGMDEQTGSLNPSALKDLDKKKVELGENEERILAGAFVKKEEEGNVPTDDAFVELALKIEDKIKDFREDLD